MDDAQRLAQEKNFWGQVWGRWRVIVLAGLPTGAIVAGLGSRLAMLVLRLTSHDTVRGVESDDGFEIGRFTLSGTLNLMMLGAAIGIIGAAAYRTVRPWLMGPLWFRRFTVGAAAGAIAGSMLVHDDGIDFHALTPTWLAISVFIALPAAFGWAIAVVTDLVERGEPRHGRRAVIVPIVLMVAFPVVVPIYIVGLVATTARVALGSWLGGRTPSPEWASPSWTILIRAAWMVLPLWGLVALISDVQAIY